MLVDYPRRACEEQQVGCLDNVKHLRQAKVLLTRGECATYSEAAVLNTLDMYAQLSAEPVRTRFQTIHQASPLLMSIRRQIALLT